ncbi:MAG: DUF1461 domain-containing protein [Chloroflexota bacterium]
MDNINTTSIIKWAIIISIPFFLGFTWITLVIHPLYPITEYRKANFPPDLNFLSEARQQELGLVPLTQADRLELALVSVAYLESWQSPEDVIWMLDEQVLPYTGEKLFNEREIGHMIDVKVLTDVIRIVAMITAVIVIGGLFYLLREHGTRLEGYRAIFHGGIATTVILVGIAGFILLGWSLFFTQFHELLFPPGTWTFAYTDGLIRLYPEIFFFDVGVLMSIGSLVLGLIALFVGRGLVRGYTP